MTSPKYPSFFLFSLNSLMMFILSCSLKASTMISPFSFRSCSVNMFILLYKSSDMSWTLCLIFSWLFLRFSLLSSDLTAFSVSSINSSFLTLISKELRNKSSDELLTLFFIFVGLFSSKFSRLSPPLCTGERLSGRL